MLKQFEKAKNIYAEYPRTFWTLVLITFVDRVGGAMLFPFFALYLTKKFEIGMTQVGVLFAAFSVSSFIGSMLGGALTDRLGRKSIIIFGLVASSLSTLAMGLVNTYEAFFMIALFVGILTDTAGPAHQAMVADILPEPKRAQGYGILRVAFNLSVVIGPAIGGLLAARSYMALFVTDAVISLITAALVFRFIPETRPEINPDAPQESMVGSFSGYFRVLRDTAFMLFLGASMLMVLTYMNMNTTLGVFLRDVHGVPEAGYGWLLSLNAAMVVLFQFPITRRIENQQPLLMMAAGTSALCNRFCHVRVCVDIFSVCIGDDYHYHWRDDRRAYGAGIGCQIRAGRYARTVYGNLRFFMVDSLCSWTDLGRGRPGQLRPALAVVYRRRNRLTGSHRFSGSTATYGSTR